MGFERKAVELVGEDWARIEPFNETLERLRARKLPAVKREGIAARAMMIWKIIGFEQVILHRTVMLADGCADAWNTRNPLTSVLCARALMESSALVLDFEGQLSRFCNQRDFSSIDDLIMNRTFGTRLEDWLKVEIGTESVNILTVVQKLEKEIEGAYKVYEILSEHCHPNSLGHFHFFASLDTATGTLHLSDENRLNKELFGLILTGYFLIGLVEKSLDRIDQLLPKVLQLSDDSAAET